MEFLAVLVAGVLLIVPILALIIAVSSRNRGKRNRIVLDDIEAHLVEISRVIKYQEQQLSKLESSVISTAQGDQSEEDIAKDEIEDSRLSTPVPGEIRKTEEEVHPPVDYRVSGGGEEEAREEKPKEDEEQQWPAADSVEEQELDETGTLEDEPEEKQKVTEPDIDLSPDLDLPPRSLEEQIGLVWFTRIGAVIGIVVAVWFFKYIVDNDIIGPWGRVLVGAIVGTAVLAFGEFLYSRGKSHPIFNQGILGLGIAVLLISTYASSAFYHLIPVTYAFGITALLCVLGGALAIIHKSELILVFSLLAAFLNPVMLSTGVDRPLALFSYLFVITGCTQIFAVKHKFHIATWASVIGVLVLYVGWYDKYYNIAPAKIVNDVAIQAGAYYELMARIVPI